MQLLMMKHVKKQVNKKLFVVIIKQKLDFKRGLVDKSAISKIEAIMLSLDLKATDRKCVNPALEIEEQTNEPGFAIELNDGHIITGKTTSLLGSASACLLNALKYLANIDDDILLIEPEVIEPVSKLKKGILKNKKSSFTYR